MKRRLILLAMIAAAVSAAVSGCGASSSITGDQVAKAAAATTSKHGSKVSLVIAMSSDQLPQTIHMTGQGVLDPVSRKARLTLDMSELAGLSGSGLKASQLKATEILDGTAFYMRIPLLDGKLPGGKKWMKIDIAKAGKALGLNLGQLSQPGQDPSQQLAYLRTVSDAKKVGTDTIRGVQTTHYHGLVKLDDYPKLLPKDQQAGARAAVKRLEKLSGSNSYPVDAWVGKDGLLRRMALTMNMDPTGSGQTLKMQMQEDLFDFGTPVDATPPSDDDVYDATKVTSNAIKSSGLGG